MPKIKLTEHGFNTLTGLVGGIEFENGVSVEPVSTRDAERLGAIMRVENAETSEELNIAKGIETRLRNTPKTRPEQSKTEVEKVDDKVEKSSDSDAQSESDDAKKSSDEVLVYTDAMLGNIADEKGIAGLREVAKQFDVTDNSVRGLITKILKAQQEN